MPFTSLRDEGLEDPLAVVGRDPGPESTTSTRTTPFAAASWSSTRPPSGVQRNAFESRFEMTCSTRSPSETITGGSAVGLDAVVDLAAPRLLGERAVRVVEHASRGRPPRGGP